MKRRQVANVFRWELTKHLKSPVFLLFTFLIPLIMVIAGALPAFVMERISQEDVDLVIIDETGQLAPLIEEMMKGSRYRVDISHLTRDQAMAKMEDGELDGFLHITDQSLETGEMQFYEDETMDISRADLQQFVQPAFTLYRLQISGISPEDFGSIMLPATIQLRTISGEEPDFAGFIVPLATGMMLFISVLFSGQILMQSIIKEKRNRVIEILLSSLSAGELLAGKILAFGGLAMIQITIWLSVGLAVASRYIDFSTLGISWGQLLITLPYFILGFLMLSTLFAAAAATMKDAESGSQAHGLGIMVPMLPIFLATPLIMAPNSVFARVLSFIPIFTPGTMLFRLGVTTIPTWEIVATIAVLLAGTILMLRLGARIYEGSVLKYNAAASIKEIIGMARKSP